LKDVGEVAKRYPTVRLIIDIWGGKVKDEKLGLGIARRSGLRTSHVFVKLTSAPSCSRGLSVPQHPPQLKRLIETFGPAVFLGNGLVIDVSRSKCTYRQPYDVHGGDGFLSKRIWNT